MTDQTTDPTAPPEGPSGDPAAEAGANGRPEEGGSLLDDLREVRERIAEQTTEDFEVPNNGGVLWATYRLLPWRRVRLLARDAAGGPRARGDDLAELNANCDLLHDAAVELWLRDPRTGERRPWPGRDPDAPMTYGRELAEALRLELPADARPRDVIRLVLQRDPAVVAHGDEVYGWMQEGHASATREFSGESQGRTR